MGIRDVFKRLPPTVVQDADFGELTLEATGGCWERSYEVDGLSFKLSLSGDAWGPAPRAREVWNHLIKELTGRVAESLENLMESAREWFPGRPEYRFELEAVDVYDATTHWADYMLYFHLEEDPDGLWRVAFKDGAPVDAGRDD